jgi:hypothetical protein
MAPKLRPNPKYQTLVAKAGSSHTAPHLVLPSFVSRERIAESDKLIVDFDDVYYKSLGIKNEILAETDGKALKELYGQFGHFLVRSLRYVCINSADLSVGYHGECASSLGGIGE